MKSSFFYRDKHFVLFSLVYNKTEGVDFILLTNAVNTCVCLKIVLWIPIEDENDGDVANGEIQTIKAGVCRNVENE